jgi:hypothetical protein
MRKFHYSKGGAPRPPKENAPLESQLANAQIERRLSALETVISIMFGEAAEALEKRLSDLEMRTPKA